MRRAVRSAARRCAGSPRRRWRPALPYPLYGAYLTLEEQTPPADPAFVPIAPTYENAGMNAGYVVQWWLFAALTLVGFGYLVIREARTPAEHRRGRDVETPRPLDATPARSGCEVAPSGREWRQARTGQRGWHP